MPSENTSHVQYFTYDCSNFASTESSKLTEHKWIGSSIFTQICWETHSKVSGVKKKGKWKWNYIQTI